MQTGNAWIAGRDSMFAAVAELAMPPALAAPLAFAAPLALALAEAGCTEQSCT